MRILLLFGANEFTGSAGLARLVENGADVRAGPQQASSAGLCRRNIVRSPEAWLPFLEDRDAVVNCAGVFADSFRDSTRTVHIDAPDALYRSCERIGVRRIVLLSAVGVYDGRTPFARTKKEGELRLQQRNLV